MGDSVEPGALTRRREAIQTLAALCILIAALKLAADLLVPILLAAFFAMALTPLADRLQRRGLSPTIASLVAFFLGGVLVVLLGFLVVASLQGVEEKLPEYGAKIEQGVTDATSWLQARGVDTEAGEAELGLAPEKALDFATSLAASLAGALSNTIVVLFVMLLMMFERGVLSGAAPSAGGGATAQAMSQRVVKSVSDYLSVKTVISLFTGLFFGIACALIGVDFPVLWGLIAFLLNYVPTIGSVLAAIPPILVALVQLGPGSAALVLVANVAVNGVFGNIIEPKLMGQKAGLSTLTVFLGLIFWSWVFGPVGTVLSVPLTIVVKMLFQKPAPAEGAPQPAAAAS